VVHKNSNLHLESHFSMVVMGMTIALIINPQNVGIMTIEGAAVHGEQ